MPTSPSEILPSDPREFARTVPLTHGTWGQFKRLYKAAEATASAEPDLYGVLAARLDRAALTASGAALPVNLHTDARGVLSLAVSERRVFCLLGSYRSEHLAGYEFSPENLLLPTPLGSGEATGATSVVLCGPFVCLIGHNGLLSVFDPSNPASPTWRGQIALGGPSQVTAAFPYVYAAVSRGRHDQWSGLRVVDLTNPDAPQSIAQIPLPSAHAVALAGNILAVASNGLRLFDVANPRQPRALGTLAQAGAVTMVAVRGTLALVGTSRVGQNEPAGLHTVDISDPNRPRTLGFLDTGYYAPKAAVFHGDYAYVIPQYGMPLVVDLQTPTAPRRAGEIHTYSAMEIVVSGDLAYVGTPYGGLELYNVTAPGKPVRIGTPPRGVTIAYMKRRVRRFLRTLAAKDPDQYAAQAFAVLTAGAGSTIDFDRQWVTADILYGASDRYTQRRHGRGPLVPGPSRFRLKTREERAPDAWNNHPELAAALLENPSLPWQTHEAAYKMLRSANAPLPEFSDASLEAFLNSPAPLLTRFAARTVAASLQSGGEISPVLAALTYVQSGVSVRRTLESSMAKYAGDDGWNRDFTRAVLERAASSLQNERLPRRLLTACEFAARRTPGAAPADLVKRLTTALLFADRPSLTALVLTAVSGAKPTQALDWLQRLEGIPDAASEQVITALAETMSGQAFALETARSLALHPTSALIRDAGWRLLALSRTEGTVLSALWTDLLDRPLETPALRTAMASAAALSLLVRAGISAAMIAERLRDKPFLAGLVTGRTFAALLPTAPASVTLGLIGAASDGQWAEFRPLLLRRLREGIGAAEFWLALETALASDDGPLESRLLADPEMRDTVTIVDDPALLTVRDPALDELLGLWAGAHAVLFSPNSALLLQAATHVLPTVRAWALARVRELGLDLPFALKLMESALPSSLETGTAFFEALPVGDGQERTYALALCDSPFAPVRAIGQNFVTSRWATLPHDEILSALFESSHADTQAFVAALLAPDAPRPSSTDQFDREVLRTRNRSRRAKERVKARQTDAPTADVETLLALARSRTPRDAEWALGQLARLALSGVEIEGVSVTGVAGG